MCPLLSKKREDMEEVIKVVTVDEGVAEGEAEDVAEGVVAAVEEDEGDTEDGEVATGSVVAQGMKERSSRVRRDHSKKRWLRKSSKLRLW
jgi:hypothetical protein